MMVGVSGLLAVLVAPGCAAVYAVVVVGQLMWSVVLYNRLHALAWPRWFIKLLDVLLAVVTLALPVLSWRWWGCSQWTSDSGITSWLTTDRWRFGVLAYAALCTGVVCWVVGSWLRRRNRPTAAALVHSESHWVDVTRELGIPLAGTRRGRWFQRVPGNEQWQLEFSGKTLRVPELPAALEGLTIAHLSDWHFTGHVSVEYFEYVVKMINERRPDLVAITGDIVDRVECLEWLPRTLGQLRATEGIWFLLGNHERRLARPDEVRRRLTDLGLVDWGGRCRRVTLRGVELVVAGNELPWFGWQDPEPGLSPELAPAEFRLLLSHSPDQWRWARRHQFHLVLAGHTHGGQISLPGVGPVIAPSLDGVEYAGGVYDVAGRVMHVSRGISGKTPVRWRCLPEVALLTLVRDRAAPPAAAALPAAAAVMDADE